MAQGLLFAGLILIAINLGTIAIAIGVPIATIIHIFKHNNWHKTIGILLFLASLPFTAYLTKQNAINQFHSLCAPNKNSTQNKVETNTNIFHSNDEQAQIRIKSSIFYNIDGIIYTHKNQETGEITNKSATLELSRNSLSKVILWSALLTPPKQKCTGNISKWS